MVLFIFDWHRRHWIGAAGAAANHHILDTMTRRRAHDVQTTVHGWHDDLRIPLFIVHLSRRFTRRTGIGRNKAGNKNTVGAHHGFIKCFFFSHVGAEERQSLGCARQGIQKRGFSWRVFVSHCTVNGVASTEASLNDIRPDKATCPDDT